MTRKRNGADDAESKPESESKADAKADAKKERVIHTRVPAVLEAELKRFAEQLRVPVSNVIRTLLEDALSAADRATLRVEEQLISAATHLGEERRKLERKMPRRDPLAGVLGFQPLRINFDGKCAACDADIQRGDDAFLGLTDQPGRTVIVCPACVPQKGDPR